MNYERVSLARPITNDVQHNFHIPQRPKPIDGIEPPSDDYKSTVLPLYYTGKPNYKPKLKSSTPLCKLVGKFSTLQTSESNQVAVGYEPTVIPYHPSATLPRRGKEVKAPWLIERL